MNEGKQSTAVCDFGIFSHTHFLNAHDTRIFFISWRRNDVDMKLF